MLIVLHTLLPHEHDIDNDKYVLVISGPTEYDFSVFLKNIFFQDLGEDHLENFHISDSDQKANLDFEFVAFPLAVPPTLCNLSSKDVKNITDGYSVIEGPPDIRLILPTVGLRAPPYIS